MQMKFHENRTKEQRFEAIDSLNRKACSCHNECLAQIFFGLESVSGSMCIAWHPANSLNRKDQCLALKTSWPSGCAAAN